MAVFPAELEDVLRSLQRQIDEINTARPGPTSYGPGDGHIRLYTDTGDTGRLDPSGISIHYRGSLRGLTPLTESFANSIEGHTRLLETHDDRLDDHDGTLASHGTRLGSAELRLSGHDSDISGLRTSKANVTYVDTKASTATVNSIRDDLQGKIDGKAAITYVDAVDSRARAAQARADAAYSLAASKANVSYVDTKLDREQVIALLREFDLIKSLGGT